MITFVYILVTSLYTFVLFVSLIILSFKGSREGFNLLLEVGFAILRKSERMRVNA